MKYMADTIVKYIVDESQKSTGRILRFVLPSYPPELLFEIGRRVEEEITRIVNQRIQFEYGIAYQLGQKWLNGMQKERNIFDQIQERGWYNQTDNLTSLRHLVKGPDVNCLVVLLAGYEDINDQASLQDFFHLDQKSLWEICLKQSFESWVRQALQKYVNPDGNEDTIEKIAAIFKDLYQYGLTDPLEVSRYLESRNFSRALDARDVFKLILADLKPFGLPNMIGFEKFGKRTFANYIAAAQRFTSYSSFLDVDKKKKAKKKIGQFRERISETPEEEILGDFSDLEELLASLEEYIDTASSTARDKLVTADFIYIYDKILEFKLKSNRESKERIKKLKGQTLEVFLHALWLSLAEFKKLNGSSLALENIVQISLRSLEFRHQYGNEDKEKAQDFLQKLLGGIDEYLKQHLTLGDDKKEIKIESFLSPDNAGSNLHYTPARAAEPALVFEVTVDGEEGKSFQQKFAWSLGKNNQARFVVNLFNWVVDKYEKNIILPVFAFPYVNEMFMAKDDEDIIRILNIALEKNLCSIEDLFAAPRLDQNDLLRDQLYKLSDCYQEFLDEYSRVGLFAAMAKKYDPPVRREYSQLLEMYLSKSSETPLAPLLMKAFMLIPDKYIQNNNWQWKEFLNCGVVTPLHPALLEMIHHQHTYLCTSFCSYIRKGLAEVGTRGMAEKNWHRLVDLARIKWPLMGVLNENTRLDTSVRSFDYIHLVGNPEEGYSTISSRLLVKYEDSEDQDISDAELFRETQEVKLIKHVLLDYCKLHPYANDGLSVGIYCGGTIQQIIGGIDAFLAEITKEKADDIYSLNLTIFSDSPDDTEVLHWINAWKERWQEAEGNSGRKHYAGSKVSVFYRVAPYGDWEQLEKLIQQTDLDLIFFNNFTRAKKSQFVPLGDNCRCGFEDYVKFPVLEKVSCAVTEGGKAKERELVLSNRRFKLGTLHAEVMARLHNHYQLDENVEHVVVSTSDFQPWERVIDVAHKNCVWVVCIDSIVDEKLLSKEDNKREIIGFGTGVGPHGEYNFTISTEQFYLSDIVKKISDQLAILLGNRDENVCSRLADSLIKEAFSISGLSVVKATGPSEYVRDFIAYALVRKLLPKEDEVFCDEIISLDAFLHWFDFGPNEMRPDLLRLQAKIEDGCFNIKAQIIECKLAQESEGYLEKALQQVEEGLKQLVPKFRPRVTTKPVGVDDEDKGGYPPDQRYWWMQLHRLITSRGEIRKAKYRETLQALESLSEGCYNIEWEAAAIAFWTDVAHGDLVPTPQWSFSINGQEMNIYSVQCGKEFIQKAGFEGVKFNLFEGRSMLRYQHVRPESSSLTDNEQTDSKEIEKQVSTTCPKKEEDDKGKAGVSRVKPVEAGDGILNREIRIPERILLGSGTAGGRDVYWEFGHPDLPNRHLLIFGASGTGKTYTIQAVLAELSKCGTNSLIVDYTSGFTNKQLEPIIRERLQPKQHIIRKQPLAINPFRKQCDYIDDELLEDTPTQIAQRVSGVFAEVYKLGEQQKSVLYNAVQTGVEEVGNNFNLTMLLDKLEDIRARGGLSANPATTVINKIKPFVDMNPFGEEDLESWEKLFLDPGSKCHVLQLAGFMKDSARLITEFSLIDLYWYYRARGSKDNPRVIVLDEIQNLDHRLESPLGQFLTEGRKFGISLILATQTLSNLSKDERDRLFQASHKLFFKPADTEIKFFAQLLADATNDRQENWIQRVADLKRGECYSLWYGYNPGTDKLEVNKWFKIQIKPLGERF